MDRLKKFLNEKKVNKNFKKAGIGYRLSDDSSRPVVTQSSVASQQRTEVSPLSDAERIATADIAAQAALKRMNYGVNQESLTQRNIRLRALKELEREKKERDGYENDKIGSEKVKHQVEECEFEHSSAISGVYFTCDLLGDDQKLTKNEMRQKVEEFLQTQLVDDPLVASVLMIFSLNASDKTQSASETLKKYLTNLIEYPYEKKYHRIRMTNKVFQDRVLSIKGGKEFLLACGFEEKDLINDEQQDRFLEISDEKAADTELLFQAMEMLQTGQAVPLKLSRNATVYKLESNQVITNPKLPLDFFDLNAAEVKREQQQKEADVDKLTTLRTREMRERDQVLCNYRYKYTLLRIRFPNRYLLQGTFGCHEPFSTVRSFVEQYLADIEPLLFILIDPISGKAITDDTKTLNELNFVPAAVLHFEWDPDMQSELMRNGQEVPYLSQRFVESAEKFATN